MHHLVVGSATHGHIGMASVHGSARRFKVDAQTRHLTTILNDINLKREEAKSNELKVVHDLQTQLICCFDVILNGYHMKITDCCT